MKPLNELEMEDIYYLWVDKLIEKNPQYKDNEDELFDAISQTMGSFEDDIYECIKHDLKFMLK